MSQEKVLKTLESLGLPKPDAQVYIFLGKRGPQKGKDIAKALKMPKQHLYLVLKNLQSKGIVNATLERPAKFSALSFEKVLDLFVKAKMEEAQRIECGKNEILSDWQSISLVEAAEQSPKFTVIKGRNFIYSRLKQMVEDAKNHLSIVSSAQGLIRADEFGLLDAAFNHATKTNTKVRFLTEVSEENLKAIKILLERTPNEDLCFEGRAPELGFKLISRIVIRDDVEAAFFINQEVDITSREIDDLCLWTNSKAIVSSFNVLFDDLWQNSADIRRRIVEIETGKPSVKICVINDSAAAKKKFDEVMDSAKKEIVVVTSSSGLVAAWKNIAELKGRAERGVSVKIMAPITRDNLEAALQLFEFCGVRHVTDSYLETTIVDGKHLFQLKNTPSDKEKQNDIMSFENAFYTNDVEYVSKVENMLNDIWKNAQAPSPIVLKDGIQQPICSEKNENANIFDEYKNEYKKILGFNYRMEPLQGKITEKELIRKIATAKRIPTKDPRRDAIRLYGTMGSAIIYPPKNLNLPNFIIQVYHFNKRSSFGVENALQIFIETKIADQVSYLPAAFITDNPQGFRFRKAMHKSQDTTEVAQLLKKDELKVQSHGDRLFVGWTMPIPLLPPKYTLPPGCIMFEGYGKIKSYTSEVIDTLNRRITYEYNTLYAFVTFMHPFSKYYGPGSDALLHRDIAMASYPWHISKETNILDH
jgi:sugar-specific transcriptional regulator TrmB